MLHLLHKFTRRPSRTRIRYDFLRVSVAVAVLGFPAPAMARIGQSSPQEITALRAEVATLRDELEALRRLVEARSAPPLDAYGDTIQQQVAPSREPARQRLDADQILPLLQAQIEEHAQTKVESNSRMPVRLFGTILSNTFFNSGEANWLDVPNVVPAAPVDAPTGSFSSTLRQSRFGAIVDGPTIGSFRTSGFIAVDFFGGIPGFKTGQTMGIPRLLYGFMRLDSETTSLEFGQDLMVLAPRNPTSLAAFSFPNLFYSGNLYLRVPQLRFEQRVNVGGEDQISMTLAAVAPISGELPTEAFAFVPPKLSGERSRRPAIQTRIAWSRLGPVPGQAVAEVGMSGHYGVERTLDTSSPSWAAALDFQFFYDRLSMQGEAWVGSNIEAFGGGIEQVARARGGFIEGSWSATSRLGFNVGFGSDSIFERDTAGVTLKGNTSVFANTIMEFTPEFATSFEWRLLRTTPSESSLGRRQNHHFNLAFAYSF